jgi:hypothetical protein
MAYGTVADWQEYASARGNTAPSAADAGTASAALERASDYMRARYVLRLAEGYDETHADVIEATYIAASLELDTPGLFGGAYKPADAKVLTGVGELRWDRMPGSRTGDLRPVVPGVEDLLAPLLSSATKSLLRS